MKHYLVLVVIFSWLLTPGTSRAQVNLVPNGDFEDTANCTNLWSYMASSPWFSPNLATPDYFGVLTQCGYSSQNNPLGFQLPHSGDAYIGLYYYLGSTRDYLEIDLGSNLPGNHLYEISYYLSYGHDFKYATNSFEACFSDTIVSNQNINDLRIECNAIELNPSQQPITDTVNWIKLTGTYLSNGNERYLTIGNFSHDSLNMNILVNNSAGNGGAYYYVDDVSVIDLGPVGLNENSNAQYSIYPNPTSTIFNIKANKIIRQISLYDMKGSLMMNGNYGHREVEIDISKLHGGIYFVAIHTDTAVRFERIVKL